MWFFIIELDSSNHATKSDIENATGVTSVFPKEADLAILKSEIDKLDIANLETTAAQSSKLTNVVETKVVKKTVYN